MLNTLDFITAYGMRHCTLTNRVFSPAADPYPHISTTEAMQMLERIAYDAHNTPGGMLEKDYKLIVGGVEQKVHDLSEILNAKQPTLALEAIYGFEQIFRRNADPMHFIGQHQSGNRDARLFVQRLSLFPIEGINVWSEFAIPEYARYQSQNMESFLEYWWQRQHEHGTLISMKGPMLPALSQERTLMLLKNDMPDMRDELLERISRAAPSKPQYTN
jgi:hypothetical protein